MQYWIGLKYDKDASKWEWDSGEPLSYMNWDMSNIHTPGFAIPRGIHTNTNNFVDMSSKRQWERVHTSRSIQMAVIERDKSQTESVSNGN